MKTINRLITWLAVGLLVASVVKELRKPAAERTWHGTIAGVFPYDLRIPTLERLRSSIWDPRNPRILVPTLFGVGWTFNLGALAHLLKSAG